MITILIIEGMSCMHCQRRVKQSLEAVSGVESVEVSLEENTAKITHSQNTAKEQLIEAVEEAGYSVI